MNDDKDGPNNTLLNKKNITPTKIFKNQLKTWPDIRKYFNVFKNLKIGQQPRIKSKVEKKTTNRSIWINPTVSSVSILFNSSISSRSQTIVRKTFLNYNFFCFRKRAIFSPKELHSSSVWTSSDSTLEYWVAILQSWKIDKPRILQ